MQTFSAFNNGNKYVLLVIDVFSRYVWTSCLKSKSPKDVVESLASILNKYSRMPKFVQHDKGKEFLGKAMKKISGRPRN